MCLCWSLIRRELCFDLDLTTPTFDLTSGDQVWIQQRLDSLLPLMTGTRQDMRHAAHGLRCLVSERAAGLSPRQLEVVVEAALLGLAGPLDVATSSVGTLTALARQLACNDVQGEYALFAFFDSMV